MRRSILRTISDSVLAGVLALLPLLATFIALRFLFRIARDGSLWALDALLSMDFVVRALLFAGIALEPGVAGVEALPAPLGLLVSMSAALVTVVSLGVTGWLSTRVIGRRLLVWVHGALGALPGIGLVYRGVVRLVSALEGQVGPAFDTPVRIPVLGADVACFGFVTRQGSTHSVVFVPTSPNPTSGFLLVVGNDLILDAEIEAADAVSAILSAGVLLDVDRLMGGESERAALADPQRRPRPLRSS